MALIDCPDCGKQVSSSAPACPNCGAPIAPTPPATAHEVSKPKKKSSGCLVIIGVLVGLGLIGSLLGDDSDSSSEYVSSTPTREAAQPVVNGDLRAMIKECEANQVAFEDKWKGTTVRISGVVKEIDAGVIGGSLRMRKPGGNRYESISFADIPRDVLGRLSKGDQVTVRCERVMEVMGDPTFSDCVLE
jgi:hypothetical protein